uniref:Secreted protein n=1 Tax=Anguilla anguilla TaxID=7936 RepID=A0A0E9RSW4_ANGAN
MVSPQIPWFLFLDPIFLSVSCDHLTGITLFQVWARIGCSVQVLWYLSRGQRADSLRTCCIQKAKHFIFTLKARGWDMKSMSEPSPIAHAGEISISRST